VCEEVPPQHICRITDTAGEGRYYQHLFPWAMNIRHSFFERQPRPTLVTLTLAGISAGIQGASFHSQEPGTSLAGPLQNEHRLGGFMGAHHLPKA
jgi:hypothetical protein